MLRIERVQPLSKLAAVSARCLGLADLRTEVENVPIIPSQCSPHLLIHRLSADKITHLGLSVPLSSYHLVSSWWRQVQLMLTP